MDNGMAKVRDPSLAKNRIFLGNLPTCSREELESICNRYGTILGSMVQKNFGFVQFETETVANKAAQALNGSLFKGNKITVRNAGAGKGKKPKPKAPEGVGEGSQQQQHLQHQQQPENLQQLQQQYHAHLGPDYNDCEIIVVNKAHTEYAEYIEQRLKRLYLKVDLLFPNEEVPIGKVLANISSRGCLYAVLVTAQNEEHRSITVNILYGQPAEHRNMPVDDAINLIATDFQTKLKEERQKVLLPTAVPIIPPTTTVPVVNPLKERHPEAIQTLLNLLADNLPLTVLQYDRIIKYLQDRRELQMKVELGDAAMDTTKLINQPPFQQQPKVVEPDPEIELQKKILNILNKSSVTESKSNLLYPTVQSLKNDPNTVELLKDDRVQRALDSLMSTNLVSTIEEHFKFK